MKLIETILNGICTISKPQKKFLLKAFNAYLSIQGKLNFSNMCRYIGLSERTFARHFVKFFDFANLNTIIINRLNVKEKAAMAFDPFYIPKSGEATYGKGNFWSGCSGKSEKGLEGSLLSVIDLEQRTGYAFHAKQTPNEDGLKSEKNLSKDASRIDFYLKYVLEMALQFPKYIKHLLVDAQFFNRKFVNGICDTGLHVISRMRKDAQLLSLYTGKQKKRGRPKKYGGVIDFELLDPIAIKDEPKITLRSVEAYSVCLKRTIIVVKVSKLKNDGTTMDVLMFSTDLTMAPIDIYEYYTARFQIEFVIRDAKQYTGLTHCQSRNKDRINFHLNMSFSAINIAKLEEHQRRGYGTDKPCSVGTQKVMHHNEMLIQSIFPMFDLDINQFKSHSAYRQALSYGAIHV